MTRRPRFWSNVLAIAYKEGAIIRHDRAFLAAVVVQPVSMLLLFGYVLSNKPANVPWAVLDNSQTAASRRLVQEIATSGYFLPPRSVAGYGEGLSMLREARAMVLFVVPANFRRAAERGRPRTQLLIDGSDPLSAARVAAAVGEIAGGFEIDPGPALRRAASTPPGLAGPVDMRQRFWFNPTLRDRNFFLAALAGMMLTNLCLSVTTLALVAERESGTYEQTLSLPTRPVEIILGKLLPHVVIGYLVLIFATVMPGVVFGVWPQGSWFALFLVTLPFLLASLAIGVFVSSIAHTSAQSVFITVFFIMPSFVLSGVMLPYQFMPDGVRQVGGLFPLRWYQIAIRRIIQRGAGVDEVLAPIVILVTGFVVMMALTRWRMKPRLG